MIIPMSRIDRFIEQLKGKKVLAQFGDSSLAVHGTTMRVQEAKLDKENQLFTVYLQDSEPWVFQYTEIMLLTESRLIVKNAEAVLRLEVIF